MRIQIISVGKLDLEHSKLADEYRRRIGWKLTQHEITYKKKLIGDNAKEFEASLILDKISKNSIIYCLDERGKEYNSHQFSEELKKALMSGVNIDFLIGGAHGLSADLKTKGKVVSLSRMTMPHKLAKVFA